MSRKTLVAGVAAGAIAAGGIAAGLTISTAADAAPPSKIGTLTTSISPSSGWVVATAGVGTATATCPTGTKVIGGTWDLDLGAGQAAYVSASMPDGANGWTVIMSGLPAGFLFRINAVCASVTSGG